MSEEQNTNELPGYLNYNIEAGIILSGMLVADATGEKVIVKVAGDDPVEVVARLEATIAALVETGNYERLSDRYNRIDGERQQSTDNSQQKNDWGGGSTTNNQSKTDEPMTGEDGNFQVKEITFLKTRKGDLKCVINGTEDGEAVWLDDKFIQQHRDGNYAQYFPQHNHVGQAVDVFANENFTLTRDGDKNVLYDIENGGPALICHWKRNGKFVNLVKVELMG